MACPVIPFISLSSFSPFTFPFFVVVVLFADISIAPQALPSNLLQNLSHFRSNWNRHWLASLKVLTLSFRLDHTSQANYLKHLILYRRQT